MYSKETDEVIICMYIPSDNDCLQFTRMLYFQAAPFIATLNHSMFIMILVSSNSIDLFSFDNLALGMELKSLESNGQIKKSRIIRILLPDRRISDGRD